MNNLLLSIANLLYPEMSDEEIMQRISQVKQENPSESDDNLILGMIDDYINDDSDEDD